MGAEKRNQRSLYRRISAIQLVSRRSGISSRRIPLGAQASPTRWLTTLQDCSAGRHLLGKPRANETRGITSRRLIDSRPLRQMRATTFSLGKDERWLNLSKAIDCPTPIRARSCARSRGHIWCGYELYTSTRSHPGFALRSQLPGLWIARVETAPSEDEKNSLRNYRR